MALTPLTHLLSIYSVLSGSIQIDPKIHFCLQDLKPLNKTNGVPIRITEKRGVKLSYCSFPPSGYHVYYRLTFSFSCVFVNKLYVRTVLDLQKNWEDCTQSSHVPPTQFILLLISCIFMIYLLKLMNQYWHIAIN